jgi:NAD+ kinase
MSSQLSLRNGPSGKLSFKHIGLIAKTESKASMEFLKLLLPVLKKFKRTQPHAKISLDASLAKLLPKAPFFSSQSAHSLGASSDLLLSIGGDGTLLRAARLLLETEGWKSAAILGINTGRLGFLTLLSAHDLSKLEFLLKNPWKSEIEERACLEVRVIRNLRCVRTFHVLNDCVLKNGALSRLLEFGLSMNKEFLSSYRADGFIISTPTGSTAYNLAAGGSILEPQIPAIQLTPICAQSFSNKPIVVCDQNLIVLSIENSIFDAYLTLDGHTSFQVKSGDCIEIRRSPKSIRLLLPSGKGHSHYIHSLRQKLKWGLVSPTTS